MTARLSTRAVGASGRRRRAGAAGSAGTRRPPAPAATSATASRRRRASRSLVQQLERLLRPADRRLRVLLAGEQRQVGVGVGVDRPVGSISSSVARCARCESRRASIIFRNAAGPQVLAEEDAQLERVAVDRRRRLLEPLAQRSPARRRDPVERLVGPLVLLDPPRLEQPALDELRQQRVELALRRRPEEPDAAARSPSAGRSRSARRGRACPSTAHSVSVICSIVWAGLVRIGLSYTQVRSGH